MSAAAEEILRDCLERSADQEETFSLVEWDDLRTSRRSIDLSVLGAAHQLFHNDLNSLISILSEREQKSVAGIGDFLLQFWSGDIAAQWIKSSKEPHMRVCGMQIHLRWICYQNLTKENYVSELRLLQDLMSHDDILNDAKLWWEAASIAGRYGYMYSNLDFVSSLYEISTHAITEKEFLPNDELLKRYRRTNSGVLGLLPYISSLSSELGKNQFSEEVIDAFKRNLLSELRSEELPISLDSDIGQLYLDSCSLAIMMSPDTKWWADAVLDILRTNAMWIRTPRPHRIWKAAWLLSAVALASIKLEQPQSSQKERILFSLGNLIVQHRALLFWEQPAGNYQDWLVFMRVLGKALSQDGTRGAERIAQITSELRSPEMICHFLQHGGQILPLLQLRSIVSDLFSRYEFYTALKTEIRSGSAS